MIHSYVLRFCEHECPGMCAHMHTEDNLYTLLKKILYVSSITDTDDHVCSVYQFILYLLCLVFGGEL